MKFKIGDDVLIASSEKAGTIISTNAGFWDYIIECADPDNLNNTLQVPVYAKEIKRKIR